MNKNIFSAVTGILIAFSGLAVQASNLTKNKELFESSVARNEIVIDFNKDMILTRKNNSDFVHKRIEQTLDIKSADGLTKQVVVRCDLTQETKNKTLNLGSTEKDGKWAVKKIEKIGFSVQRWILSRKKQNIDMTCVALRKMGENMEITSMDSSFIDQALTMTSSPLESKTRLAGDNRSE